MAWPLTFAMASASALCLHPLRAAASRAANRAARNDFALYVPWRTSFPDLDELATQLINEFGNRVHANFMGAHTTMHGDSAKPGDSVYGYNYETRIPKHTGCCETIGQTRRNLGLAAVSRPHLGAR